MPPSGLTLTYDALLSTTLFNYHKTIADAITGSMYFFYVLMKREDGYKRIESIGERAAFPLMYENGQADSYSGYDPLDVTPMDGITMAFYEWRNASVPIAISGSEEKKNKGEAKMLDLLKIKTEQAKMGIREFFVKKFLLGAGGSAIATPYTSPVNGSAFMDPLPLLVKYDPTTSTVVGNINQGTYQWWRNKTMNDTSTTFKGFLKNLRHLNNDASKGPGGAPDLHLTGQGGYELYEQSLAEYHRNTSYQKADIPFDNILFKGKPVTWDENIPDVLNNSETQSATNDSWYMLNTKFWGIQVEADTDFAPTPFESQLPHQDAKIAQILWMGAAVCSNRKKQAVMGGIDTTVAS